MTRPFVRPWSPAVRAVIHAPRGPWTEMRVVIPTRRAHVLLQLADILDAGAAMAGTEATQDQRAEALHLATVLRQSFDVLCDHVGPLPAPPDPEFTA